MHIVELKRGVLEIAGRDRARFLHNMCTNDIKALMPGGGCYAAMVNRQGKMVGAFQVTCLEESFLVDGEPDAIAAVRDAMRKFIIMDDVTVEDRAHRIVGVLGASPPDGRRVTQTVLGYEVWDDPSLVPTPGAAEAYERARVEIGWPRWGVDMTSDHLPMEAGLEPIAISYAKGCYIGQEVIQRVKTYSEPPHMLVSLRFDGLAPAPGPILAEGKPVGQMTSASGSSGLGMVRKEWKSPGTHVKVGTVDATVQSLPWQQVKRINQVDSFQD